jgi:hypothetical protein
MDWRKIVGDSTLAPLTSTLPQNWLQISGFAKLVPEDSKLSQFAACVGVQFLTSPHEDQMVALRLLRLPAAAENSAVGAPSLDPDALEIAALRFDFAANLATWEDQPAGSKNVWECNRQLGLETTLTQGDRLLLITEHANVSLAALSVNAAAR